MLSLGFLHETPGNGEMSFNMTFVDKIFPKSLETFFAPQASSKWGLLEPLVFVFACFLV